MIKPNWKIFKAKFSKNPESNFDDAQSFLFGYLIIKPKYDAFEKDFSVTGCFINT
jgi:hypothetical protein